MSQYHVIASLRQLIVTIIIGIVTRQTQRVALLHLHMSESLEGVGLFIEVRTVTEQVSPLMTEMHIAM